MTEFETIEILTSPKMRSFISANSEVDPLKLILNPPNEIKGFESLVADQIKSIKKAKIKLKSWIDNPSLLLPPPISVEQSSSELTAAFKANLIDGEILVDLSGGMGVDCLALSEKFTKTIYVEKDPWLCEVFHYNVHVLERLINIKNQTAEEFLYNVEADSGTTFYIDPSRRGVEDKRNHSISGL